MNKKNVFISYGHNCFDTLVSKVVTDLRMQGFNVFFDVDYLQVGDWESIIDEHIRDSMYFVFMVSARSVSFDGYCLNELCRAGEVGATIIPVLLDDSLVPLSINKYQRLSLVGATKPDGTPDEYLYNEFLIKLVPILQGNNKIGFSNDEIRLKNILKPISSREDLFRYYLNFCGRKSAFDDFEKFLDSDKSFFWVPASPGAGKTAFSSMLCWRYSKYIGAVHFCKFNNSDRVNPRYIVCSIAYHLSNVIPEYKAKLIELIDTENITDKNAARLFEYLLAEPIYDIRMEHPIVVIIDALDECSWRGGNELATLLYRSEGSLPKWLKFVVTSRNEPEIRRVFINMNAFVCKGFEQNNLEDLKEYYRSQFPALNDEKLQTLLSKSENSFLYASEICKQIKTDNMSLDDINCFPIGIYGFFNDCFTRIFGEESNNPLSFEETKPLLELLCIARESVSSALLCDILGYDEYQIKDILARIGSLFPIRNHNIEPLHKSLIDWLTNEEEISQLYFISRKNGYQRLYNYLNKKYVANAYDKDILTLKYYGKTLIDLNKYEELADLLNDYAFQNKKIILLQFDSGLEQYLDELKVVNQYVGERMPELFSSETFIRIFSNNRRLLYNSGLFFKLKELGFSVALKKIADDWGLEGEIGKVMYYYIVEDFNRAIKKIEKLLSTSEELKGSPSLLAEIYNTKGLSERKLVRFDDALESLDNAIENAEEVLEDNIEDSDPHFEMSLSYLIKGKIYSHMLDFSKANHAFRTAVKILQNHIDEMEDGDKKTSNLLFLAEDYRVFADSCIFQEQYEKAGELLKKCEEIYTENNATTDRYFIRYQYTTLLYKILTKDLFDVRNSLMKLLNKVSSSKYDKGQINFYLALCILFENGNAESDLKKALSCAEEASEINFSIDAYMEEAECNLIQEMIQNRLGKKALCEQSDNEYISTWVDYMKNLFVRINEND